MPFIVIYIDRELDANQKRQFSKEIVKTASDAIEASNPPARKRIYNLSITTVDPVNTSVNGELVMDGAVFPWRIEISSFDIGPKQKESLVASLTPKMAELMGLPNDPTAWDRIWIRFHHFVPDDFAIGGKFVSQLIKS